MLRGLEIVHARVECLCQKEAAVDFWATMIHLVTLHYMNRLEIYNRYE